jgi:hypothetical protein
MLGAPTSKHRIDKPIQHQRKQEHPGNRCYQRCAQRRRGTFVSLAGSHYQRRPYCREKQARDAREQQRNDCKVAQFREDRFPEYCLDEEGCHGKPRDSSVPRGETEPPWEGHQSQHQTRRDEASHEANSDHSATNLLPETLACCQSGGRLVRLTLRFSRGASRAHQGPGSCLSSVDR